MRGRLPHRVSDPVGAGHFGAPRGSRTHNGQDYNCYPGTLICALSDGIVTKTNGYPYSGTEYRYIEIRDALERSWRYFYVRPTSGLAMGETVYAGNVIGYAQDIAAKLSSDGERTLGDLGMSNHVHLEIRLPDGSYVDPVTV